VTPLSGAGEPPVAEVLRNGEMAVHGRIAGSSNATLLVTCALTGAELLAVYKPARGERPLWDFPGGLYRREVAAFVLSRELGWDIVPDTVARPDGPFGPGSVQRLVPEDRTSHYFTLLEDPKWHPALVVIAAFDVVANNADRKSGHVLLAEDRLWAIDNGLAFHPEPKLRTVIWDFAGSPLPSALLADITRLLAKGLPAALDELIDPDEQAAVVRRAEALATEGRLPEPDTDRQWPQYPWPLV
jgi:uncharacterized repeat protein (TIGR03843 family)